MKNNTHEAVPKLSETLIIFKILIYEYVNNNYFYTKNIKNLKFYNLKDFKQKSYTPRRIGVVWLDCRGLKFAHPLARKSSNRVELRYWSLAPNSSKMFCAFHMIFQTNIVALIMY